MIHIYFTLGLFLNYTAWIFIGNNVKTYYTEKEMTDLSASIVAFHKLW